MFLNPLMVLSTRFVAPVLIRFLGIAVSNTLLRSTIGTLVPFLIELPIQRLLQIALFRPITGFGSLPLQQPALISSVLNTLSLIPGVDRAVVTRNIVMFNSIIRLITWMWLMFTSISIGTLLSFVAPLTLNFLAFMGDNISSLGPVCSYLISSIKPIIPSFSFSFFSTIRDFLVAILSYDNIRTEIIPVAKTSLSWWSIIVVITELAHSWVFPYLTFDDLGLLINAIGATLVPWIPSTLATPMAMLGHGIICMILSPFTLTSSLLSTYMVSFGSYTLAHIPIEAAVAAVKLYFFGPVV